jgi:hypothetical protein
LESSEQLRETVAETGESIVDTGRNAYRKAVKVATVKIGDAAGVFGRNA